MPPIQGFLSGYLQTGGSTGQVLAAMISPVPAQIRYVIAAAQGGGTTYVLDVLLNSVSIWTNPADRPILSGAAAGRFVSGRINRSAIGIGDILELVVATAGNKSRLVATVALEEVS
jgi:hypothetical protein